MPSPLFIQRVVKKLLSVFFVVVSFLLLSFPLYAENVGYLKSGQAVDKHVSPIAKDVAAAGEIQSPEVANANSTVIDPVEERFKTIAESVEKIFGEIFKASDCKDFFGVREAASQCVGGSGLTVTDIVKKHKPSYPQWVDQLENVVKNNPGGSSSIWSDDAGFLAQHIKLMYIVDDFSLYGDPRLEEVMNDNVRRPSKYGDLALEPWTVEHIPALNGWGNPKFHLRLDGYLDFTYSSKDPKDLESYKNEYEQVLRLYPDKAPILNKILELFNKKISGM